MSSRRPSKQQQYRGAPLPSPGSWPGAIRGTDINPCDEKLDVSWNLRSTFNSAEVVDHDCADCAMCWDVRHKAQLDDRKKNRMSIVF